jgi:hypothetical protein
VVLEFVIVFGGYLMSVSFDTVVIVVVTFCFVLTLVLEVGSSPSRSSTSLSLLSISMLFSLSLDYFRIIYWGERLRLREREIERKKIDVEDDEGDDPSSLFWHLECAWMCNSLSLWCLTKEKIQKSLWPCNLLVTLVLDVKNDR